MSEAKDATPGVSESEPEGAGEQGADAALALRSRLFLKYQPMLTAYLRAFVWNATDVEDLLQEVGVVVLTRKDGPTAGYAFAPWCRGIARNLILHHRRTRGRSREIQVDDVFEAAAEQAFAEAEPDVEIWEIRRRALIDCLAQLEGRGAEVLTLRYVDGLTSDAIGDRLRRSSAAVRMTLMRLRQALLRCLERRLARAS